MSKYYIQSISIKKEIDNERSNDDKVYFDSKITGIVSNGNESIKVDVPKRLVSEILTNNEAWRTELLGEWVLFNIPDTDISIKVFCTYYIDDLGEKRWYRGQSPEEVGLDVLRKILYTFSKPQQTDNSDPTPNTRQ